MDLRRTLPKHVAGADSEHCEPIPQDDARDKPSSRSHRRNSDTRRLLIDAAAIEFNEAGYDGTDSNRIARRAGFAPQTFYRWFKDKEEVFVEVYHRWQAAEAAVLKELLSASAPDEALADACVAHHRSYLRFRRSLRQLSYENTRVRDARAESRKRQIAFICSLEGAAAADEASVAAALLQLERLSDALAEGEFEDMGMSENGGRAALAALIGDLRG
jgi:AcrR family transcriptional regulator